MNNTLSENEIDKRVIAEADNDDAWEKPISVNRRSVFSISLPKPAEIVSEKHILGGEPVFRGTRVPVSALFDNLESGSSIDEFLEKFPTVERTQAIQVLEYFKNSLSRLKEAA